METSLDHPRFRVAELPISMGVAAGIALIVVARWLDQGAPSVRAIAGAAVAVLVPSIVVAVFERRDRPVAAAAVLLACAPTVLVATADGRWQGGVALLMVALVCWSHRRAVAAILVVLGVGAWVAWWRAGFDRGKAPGPSWRDVVGETGDTIRRALTSVGLAEALMPLSAALLLSLGIGILVGTVVLGGRPARAAAVPVAVAALVGGVWAIRLWRGSVDPLGGAWLLSTAVALVAVVAEPPSDVARRIAISLVVTGSIVWLAALWEDVGADAVPAVLVAGGVGLVVTTLIVVSLGRRPAR